MPFFQGVSSQKFPVMKLFDALNPSAFPRFRISCGFISAFLRNLSISCRFHQNAKCGQLLGKGLICGIYRNPRRIKTKDSGGVHVIENQPIGPMRACPSGIGYAVRAAPVGIRLGSIEDNPNGGWGLRVEG